MIWKQLKSDFSASHYKDVNPLVVISKNYAEQGYLNPKGGFSLPVIFSYIFASAHPGT